MPSDQPRTDIYLSYDRSDAEGVELASMLEDAGLRVWFDRWQVAPGERWDRQIEHAITGAPTIGVCFGRGGPTPY